MRRKPAKNSVVDVGVSGTVCAFTSSSSVTRYESPTLVATAANAGRQLFETVERSEQNAERMNVREQRAESQQVEETPLDVLDAGTKIAEENDAMSARLDYQTVAPLQVCGHE